MNFDEAIHSHSEWKNKLRKYLQNPDKSLSAASIEPDNSCSLGQWIHGDGEKFSTDAVFQELVHKHQTFHRAAADLVRRADRGEKVSVEAELGAKSAFSDSSQRVIQLIMELKRKTIA